MKNYLKLLKQLFLQPQQGERKMVISSKFRKLFFVEVSEFYPNWIKLAFSSPDPSLGSALCLRWGVENCLRGGISLEGELLDKICENSQQYPYISTSNFLWNLIMKDRKFLTCCAILFKELLGCYFEISFAKWSPYYLVFMKRSYSINTSFWTRLESL